MTVEELSIIIKADISDALKGIKEVTNAVKQAVSESISPMQQMAAKTKEMANNSASSIGVVKTQMMGLKNTIAGTTAQQEKLINRINDMKATLLANETGTFRMSASEVLDMRAEIERLEKQLINLQGTSKTTENQFEKTFNKGIKSAKRFGIMLLGARSMFLLFRKGMQSAIQTEEGLAAQNEVTSNILGQLFVPAMKMALNVVQYLMIGMALLIKMFTGYDALARVTTKNMNKAAKATKGLTKELTAMDEITNLSEDGVGLGLDVKADLNALEEFTKKIEEVEKLFADWNVQSFVDSLKDVWDWLEKNKKLIGEVGLAFATLFAAAKISGWLSSISRLIGFSAAGGGVGLAGIAGLLGTLAAFGGIAIGVSIIVKGLSDVISAYNELNKLKKANKSQEETNVANLKELLVQYRDLKNSKGLTKNQETVYQKLKKDALEFIKKGYSFSDIGFGTGGGGRFATGGVVTKPFMGLVGEYPDAKSNPEIISPQSIMRDTLIEALQSVQSTQSNNSNVVLNINGRELAKAIQSDLNYESNRMGTSTAIRRV